MTGPAPAVAAVRSAIATHLADVGPGLRVLVACSGGADSLALAAGTAFVSRKMGWSAEAVVVDHGLQAGSDAVAEGAAQACRALGLDARVLAVVATGTGGPEAAARAARYAALEATDAAAVLLGHTLDDQAETVLLGLARGSGARSLAGMPAVRGRFRRPLLGLRRADTEAACAALGLSPWHDPTNDGAHPDAPLRSRVRSEVLPTLERVLGPGVAQALARSAAQLREDADALDELADTLLARLRAVGRDDADGSDEPAANGAGLDVEHLRNARPAVRRRALRSAMIAAGSPAGALTREHVLAVDALVVDWHGQGPVALPGGVAARRAYGRLALGPTDTSA